MGCGLFLLYETSQELYDISQIQYETSQELYDISQILYETSQKNSSISFCIKDLEFL